MNKFAIKSMLVASAVFAAVGSAAAEDAVYSCANADGSVELTSAPNGNNCEKLVSAPDTTPAAPAPGTPATASADGGAAGASGGSAAPVKAALIPPPAVAQQPRTPVETRLSQYRDAMIEQASQASQAGSDTQQANGPTSASSRRYLMTTRSAYQQALGIKPQ